MEDGHDLTDDEIQEVLFILMADYWQRGLD